MPAKRGTSRSKTSRSKKKKAKSDQSSALTTWEQKKQRINMAYQWLCDLVPRSEVERNLIELYGVGDRTARRDIEAAIDILRADGELEPAAIRPMLVRKFTDLAEKAMAIEQASAAVSAMDKVAKIYGAYAPVQAQVSVGVVALTPQQKRDRLKQLVAEVAGE